MANININEIQKTILQHEKIKSSQEPNNDVSIPQNAYEHPAEDFSEISFDNSINESYIPCLLGVLSFMLPFEEENEIIKGRISFSINYNMVDDLT